MNFRQPAWSVRASVEETSEKQIDLACQTPGKKATLEILTITATTRRTPSRIAMANMVREGVAQVAE